MRVYRTADGRHVPEGDPDAAFLAYTDADDLPDDIVAELDGKATKRGRKPANKQTAAPEGDKTAEG